MATPLDFTAIRAKREQQDQGEADRFAGADSQRGRYATAVTGRNSGAIVPQHLSPMGERTGGIDCRYHHLGPLLARLSGRHGKSLRTPTIL